MGNFVSILRKLINWIGNCIHRIISWWGEFKERVNQNTYNFMIGNRNQILNANNPVGVGEILAINDEKSQLEDIAAKKYRNLTYEDQQRVDDLLDARDY